jgi:hypothetical protein
MNAPEVNTLDPVSGSAISSKDHLSVCSTCFNLDPELIPPDQDEFFDDPRGANGTKRTITSGGVMRASAAGGCISCAALLEGVLTHCPLLDDKFIWNPQQFKLVFHMKRSLVLEAKFILIRDESRPLYDAETYRFGTEFYTRTG